MQKGRVKGLKTSWKAWKTHDCAFLEPLAFPPDLPPVILMGFVGFKWVMLVVRGWISGES